METWFAPVNGLDVALQKAGAPSSYEGLIATRCRALMTLSTANKQIMTRTAHVAADDINVADLEGTIANYRLGDSLPGEAQGAGTVTTTASIEYGGQVAQALWAGDATSVAIADGGHAVFQRTTGPLTFIPAGATFWHRKYQSGTLGILYNGWRNIAMGEETRVAASGLADQTMATGSLTGGTAGAWSSPPLQLFCNTTKASVCVIGDSKAHGYLDTAESTSAAGPGRRGEICKSFPDTLPFVNFATGGMRANLWATDATSRKQLLAPFSHYVIQLGHNDFMISGDSAATVQANIEAIIAEILVANPAAKITIATPGHKSASTSGNWISDADQTTSGGNAARVTYNGVVRASGVAGQNNGFFEVAAQIESALNNGLWKSDGSTPDLYTADGVHETPAGYDLIVSAGAIDLTKFAYP